MYNKKTEESTKRSFNIYNRWQALVLLFDAPFRNIPLSYATSGINEAIRIAKTQKHGYIMAMSL